ncbi:MAG: fluoride efflux transporter CrcB [Planctomycetaceae bacterium]
MPAESTGIPGPRIIFHKQPAEPVELMNHLAIPFAVGLGGCVGAVSRFYISEWVSRSVSQGLAFVGTLCVNLLGCFIIGVLVAAAAAKARWMTPLMERCLLTGVLGSLTTFSTFSLESVNLVRTDRAGAAVLYAGVSVVAGLTLVWLGMRIGQHLFAADG